MSNQPTNIHDAFFKQVLGDPHAADTFLVSDEVLHQALQRILPDQAEEIMASFGHQYFEAGIAVGEARGEAKGEAKGEAQALVRLLEKRFGAVPPELRTRIFAADKASIEAWFDRAIDARELTSVFGPN